MRRLLGLFFTLLTFPALAQVGPPPTTQASVAINVSTATTTQLVAALTLSNATRIYVTGWDVVAGGTGNFSLVSGTGSNCGTGQVALTGTYNLTAQNGLARGSGWGAVLVVPLTSTGAPQALCIVTSAAVQYSGRLAYAQY